MSAKHTPMAIAAARELCRQHAVACEVNAEDCWNLYAADFLAHAQRVLQAAGAPELLQALREAEAGLEFAGADKLDVVGEFVPAPLAALRIVRAAIAKATGSAS